MTRKDYVLIAETIRDVRNRPTATPEHKAALDATAVAFASRLSTANGGFKRHRFLDACGVPG